MKSIISVKLLCVNPLRDVTPPPENNSPEYEQFNCYLAAIAGIGRYAYSGTEGKLFTIFFNGFQYTKKALKT
jgi:hypothetical protein